MALISEMSRATLEAIGEADGGRECTPSHPVMQELVRLEFVTLSDARCGFELLKNCWAKITDSGAEYLRFTA